MARWRWLAACGCLVLAGLLGGCARFDPAKSVEVQVSGITNSADQDAVLEQLETMYDRGAHSRRISSSQNKDVLTIRMYPVSDIEAFTRRIHFGTVLNVTGRTVKIQYGGQDESLEIV